MCVDVCDCANVTPNIFEKSIPAFAHMHHHSTALSTLQQYLVDPFLAAFPPSQHDSYVCARTNVRVGVDVKMDGCIATKVLPKGCERHQA